MQQRRRLFQQPLIHWSPRSRHRRPACSPPAPHQATSSCQAVHNSGWDREDDWGASLQPTAEEELGGYLDDDSPAAYGYEVVGGALAFAVVAAALKVLWYLAVVCYTLLATALQYSVVALALVMVVIFVG